MFWQFTLYRLSGARLRVQTVLEFHNEYGHVQTVTGTRRMTWDDFIAGHPGEPTRLGIEVVRVRVTNVGRSPVSVDNIALDIGRSSRLRRGRSSVVPWSFRNIDASEPELNKPTSGPTRLEAGSTTSRVYHLWPLVEYHADRDGEIVIRGTATAAGRRPTLSRRKFAWRFTTGDESWFLDSGVTPDVRVYRELWRHSYDEMVGGIPRIMRREVVRKLEEGASKDELQAYLDEVGRSDELGRYYGVVAFDAHKAFHKCEPDPKPAGGEGEPSNDDDQD
ncbi:hypothetical protein M2359_000474 [Gordonia amarae]|uniref:hypothetical protein n=1 Tax=Gordonia amarae TaxID=36821 RepID=UPI001110E6D9|nr:hypothetical protein [Gordonia amarae]MCS3876845.1 hypothetical protein [Gordonia amarae]QHN15683.1 hypothetical protein GII35_00635 [Gordonia amarae]QHN20252.1 hypothetical protein GII34_00635 [Gordonia amarae]QHN29103.1 hypothetical protein GII32_00635 [Gordonia amarae]